MKHSVNLRPFTVPNFVLVDDSPLTRGEGMQESPKFPLNAISADALEQLCDRFRKDVFSKAGKRDPAIDRPREG